MIVKGTLLRVQTKTKEDVFGDCLYMVEETGLTIKDPNIKDQTRSDGIKCVMLGGSGPAARKGFTVIDNEEKINRDIASGITEIVEGAKRDEIVAFYDSRAKDGTPRRVVPGSTGVVEVDL